MKKEKYTQEELFKILKEKLTSQVKRYNIADNNESKQYLKGRVFQIVETIEELTKHTVQIEINEKIKMITYTEPQKFIKIYEYKGE